MTKYLSLLPIGSNVTHKLHGLTVTTSECWEEQDGRGRFEIFVYVRGSSLPVRLRDLDFDRGWRVEKGCRPSDKSISLIKECLK